MEPHTITGKEAIKRFILAGNATFTLKNVATGNRITYKVRQQLNEDGSYSPHFVSVLTGANNQDDYTYLGCIFDEARYLHGRKSAIKPDAKTAKTFRWFWGIISNGLSVPDGVEFWHEGKCGKCGRPLTVPHSIETGIGPVCAIKNY